MLYLLVQSTSTRLGLRLLWRFRGDGRRLLELAAVSTRSMRSLKRPRTFKHIGAQGHTGLRIRLIEKIF